MYVDSVVCFSTGFSLQLYFTPAKWQRAKKVVSDSLGLVNFVIGLVNSVLILARPTGKWSFFGNPFTDAKGSNLRMDHNLIFGNMKAFMKSWLPNTNKQF